MTRYIIRRLLWVGVLLFAVSLLTFVIFFMLPSADPAALRAGRQPTPELVELIRKQLGLDRPWYVQFGDYLKGLVLHFDLGYSYSNQVAVRQLIFERMPATIWLAAGAAVVWTTIGVTVGLISSYWPRSTADRVAMGASLVAISAPVYWLGLVALYLFADDIGRFKLLPGAGSYVGITENPWGGSPRCCCRGSSWPARSPPSTRGCCAPRCSRRCQEDYIRTARAKGLGERRVVLRHGLRSGITPIVTTAGLDLGVILGGAILTESVFNIPGIGRLAYESIIDSNLPVIQGTVIIGAFFIVMANLVVDVLYAFIDPRVKY